MNDTNNEEQIDYVAPKIEMPSDIEKKLETAGKKFPIWNPKEINQVVAGIVEEVEFLEHLNDKNGAYIMRMLPDDEERFVVFPNKVMMKHLTNLTNDGKLESLVGEKIYIQYLGEQKPRDSKLKPYKTYAVVKA